MNHHINVILRFFRTHGGKFGVGALSAAVLGLGGYAAVGLGLFDAAPRDLPPQRVVDSDLPLSAQQIEVSAPVGAPYISETRVRRGDTVAMLLRRLNVDDDALQAFLARDNASRVLYTKLIPGRSVLAATTDDGKLVWLHYLHTPVDMAEDQPAATPGTRYLSVDADGKGGFRAEDRAEASEVTARVAMGSIRSSLFAATDEAGVPDAITMQMASILSSKVDFLTSLRRGDRFRVVYETRMSGGRYAGVGRVLALEFENKGHVYDAVWFSPDGGKSGSYYDFDGHNLQGAFLKTALAFTRVSSTFGMRPHPLFGGNWRMHQGVDYAAPAGTPIRATADGTVDFAGWQNGYGNVVIIKHFDGYSTVYAHQSSIAEGIKKGGAVAQGQLIGYVGMTGWATGPHLHYEIRVNGKPVDPLSVDMPTVRTLDPKELQAFARDVTPYRDQIAMLAQFQRADVASSGQVATR